MGSGYNYDFDNFLKGNTLASESSLEEYFEGVRKLVEREDYTPGFQLLIDQDSGFG